MKKRNNFSRYTTIKEMNHNQEGYIDESSLGVGFLDNINEALYVILHNDIFSLHKQEVEDDYGKLYTIKIKCIIKNYLKTYQIYGSHHIDQINLNQLSSTNFTILNTNNELVTELNTTPQDNEEFLIDELGGLINFITSTIDTNDNIDRIQNNIETAIIDHVYHNKLYNFQTLLEQIFLHFQNNSNNSDRLNNFMTQEKAHQYISNIVNLNSYMENGFIEQELRKKIQPLDFFYHEYKNSLPTTNSDNNAILTTNQTQDLTTLHKQLDQALANEDYEQAAQLRDKIAKYK